MSNLETSATQREVKDEAGDRAKHLSFVAHEIRNPLATALWSAELLGRLSAEERGGPRGEKLAKMALRAVGRVRRLLEDHLLAERLDVSGVPVSLESVAVKDLLSEAPLTIGVSAISVDLEEGLAATADAQLARRALEALVLVAGRGNATVRVSGRRVGEVARLEVAGAPVAPGDLADRRPGDPDDLGPGCLGLGMARRVALALRGSLRVEEGAFILDLPVAEGRPPG